MEEVNISPLGYVLHCSQPNSISLLQVQQQLLKLCAFCTFLWGPAVLKLGGQWKKVLVCLCLLVIAGLLRSFKVSDLNCFGRVREVEKEGGKEVSVMGHLTGVYVCVCLGLLLYEGINPVGVWLCSHV